MLIQLDATKTWSLAIDFAEAVSFHVLPHIEILLLQSPWRLARSSSLSLYLSIVHLMLLSLLSKTVMLIISVRFQPSNLGLTVQVCVTKEAAKLRLFPLIPYLQGKKTFREIHCPFGSACNFSGPSRLRTAEAWQDGSHVSEAYQCMCMNPANFPES